MSTEAAVTLDKVRCQYGSVTAVADLSLSVGDGEMFGLIGPDGAGKTTTLRAMCGLLRPTAGAVRVYGHDPVAAHRALTSYIGYLPQRFSLYTDLSVDENIAFFAEIHGVAAYQPVRDRLLALTQMTPFRSRLAGQLSGGMKQKLALACTLVHAPRLLVLDEATTGVDPVARREFWKLLGDLRAQGITILMATPYLDEAERCSRVALLHEGRLLALDRPDALRAGLSGAMFEVLTSDHRRAARVLASAPDIGDVSLFGERIHVRVAADDGAVASRLTAWLAASGITDADVRRVEPTLEDVFVASLREVHA
ncbi:MAG: ABC transporter ATP-binding protein [Acidobacteriaceae bacterium]|nr:ABC transporter ATP-binding protein [Acidobacteriaceae bacterium]